jgi:hypothetical protein
MDESVDLRRSWRLNWLGSIHEFADYAAQRRHWLDPNNRNPHFSFVEYMCCYFDDLDLSNSGYEPIQNKGFLSASEVDAVRDFHAAANAYSSPTDDYDNQAILDDPNWQVVVRLAAIAKARLHILIVDPVEINALNRRL